MLFRPTTRAEVDRVASVTVPEPVGWIDADRYRDEFGKGMYRPEWTWVAEDDDGRLRARALWWGRADSAHPVALDCLSVDAAVGDRAQVATRLLTTALRAFGAAGGAPKAPLYNLTLPVGWRDDPRAADAVAWRRAAARAAGLGHEVERLRLEWTVGDVLPSGGNRLTFASAPDEEFLAAFRRIAVGSLDDETRRNVAALGVEAAAQQELEFYLGCPGDREWWRLAYGPDGELAGLAIPSATPYARNVGYLGVLPEFRGRGYVDDLLAEVTRSHAQAGAELITATTDTGNAPMAAAFTRAGYRTTEIRMIWSTPVTER
ncbi:GNAT family N-acetyltransferase [Streptomyces sp. NPDC001093]|uniref:GNAT family N-acetyltransferase n=1 Tax=Streptomyces sp. NPDC001093 TaxID=3154376 RepID=UPI00331E1A1D